LLEQGVHFVDKFLPYLHHHLLMLLLKKLKEFLYTLQQYRMEMFHEPHQHQLQLDSLLLKRLLLFHQDFRLKD
jgi:hypothetical protein